MSKARLWRAWLAGLLATALIGALPGGAQAAPSDPLFVFMPSPGGDLPVLPPPFGYLEDPCGMGVDPLGHFYVSDYRHNVIDVYDQNAPHTDNLGSTGYLGQLSGIDSDDGPCGLAFDASGHLYVNDYHRAVIRYDLLGSPTTITGASTPEATHPTGIDVDPATGTLYVDQRTYLSVFEESGAPLEEGGEPIHIGAGAGGLKDGYGVAFSRYPATQGYLYVPDAATNTIEVYDSSTPQAGPVEEIDGSETPKGEFVSLKDAAIAVDRTSGEIYVLDDLQPAFAEHPQAIVYVFNADGTYEGHLRDLVTDGMPSGLAVDNSETPTQGRVYVTSGNTVYATSGGIHVFGSIYAYGPGAASTAPITLPGAAAPSSSQPSSSQGGEGASPAPGAAAASQGSLDQALAPASSPAAKRPLAKHRKRHAKHRRAHRVHHKRVEKDR